MKNPTRTSEQIAAFKAANLAQTCKTITITPIKKSARKSQRQEWLELRDETRGMITAAKREGHLQLLPALVQRLTTFDSLLQARCFN
jgi:hypothetical protein